VKLICHHTPVKAEGKYCQKKERNQMFEGIISMRLYNKGNKVKTSEAALSDLFSKKFCKLQDT
jgi:hypothetical protein